VIVKSMQDIMAKRLELYNNGVPDMPSLELNAVVFLAADGVQSNESPEQKLQSVQMIYNLMGLASQWLTKVPRGERDELAVTIKNSASGLVRCGVPAADPLYKTNAGTADAELQKLVGELHPKIQAAPGGKFQGVKPFPKVEAGGAPPAGNVQ